MEARGWWSDIFKVQKEDTYISKPRESIFQKWKQNLYLIDKFLETHNKWSEEIENLNSSISSKEIESSVQHFF